MKKLYQVELTRTVTVVLYCEEDDIETVANKYVHKDEFFDFPAIMNCDKENPIISEINLPHEWTVNCFPYINKNIDENKLTIGEILKNQNITRNPNNLEFDF